MTTLKNLCNCNNKNYDCRLGNKFNLNNIVLQANISVKENDSNDKAYDKLKLEI